MRFTLFESSLWYFVGKTLFSYLFFIVFIQFKFLVLVAVSHNKLDLPYGMSYKNI